MKTVFRTDCGRVRPHNEDYVGIFPKGEDTLVIIADGMGGHLAGEVASRMTVDLLGAAWESAENLANPDQVENWLVTNLKIINEKIYRHANENPECQGMGTTLVVAVVNDKFSTIGHVGDSRCYILNENGFSQLTDDHSLVNELVKSGQITRSDAEHHPRKNVILRALGTEPKVDIDVKTITFEENDLLLLCSDGLTDKVSDSDIEMILQSEASLEEKSDQLVKLANDRGGDDNITLAIIYNAAVKKEGV